MDIVSAAISASEFTISNYKLLVLSLLSCCCILFLGFFALGHRDSFIGNVLEITSYLKHCHYRVPYYFIHHLGRYWVHLWEPLKWLGLPCLPVFLLFFLLLSSSHPTASPRNLIIRMISSQSFLKFQVFEVQNALLCSSLEEICPGNCATVCTDYTAHHPH